MKRKQIFEVATILSTTIVAASRPSTVAHEEFAELHDSYTSIVAPCQVMCYKSPASCSSHLHHGDIISVKDIHVIFWPDPNVGDEPGCYSVLDVSDMQEAALSKWHAFGQTVLNQFDNSTTTTTMTTAADLDSTSVAGNVTERIIAEFEYPRRTKLFTVDCTRDKMLVKDATDAAELAIFVGAAATLSIMVCCCAGLGLFLWCCFCRSSRNESGEWQEVTYAAGKGGKDATIPVETGLTPVEYSTTYGSTG